MPERHFPVRPDLGRLTAEAEALHRAIRDGDADARATVRRNHPDASAAANPSVDDARLALARSYGLPDWSRLVLACQLTDAIWQDDVDAVRELVTRTPSLLVEDARGVKGNWGPPMSYAANLGRDRIIELLWGLGATDLQFAFDRACLQGRTDTARKLHALGAHPARDAAMGPCETQNGEGLALILELGATPSDEHGDPLAPVAMVLETYCRNPAGKHRCLELLARHGAPLADTPPMAVHRGRLDLLESHLSRDPALFSRTYSHGDIWPRELGCHADESLALHGSPLAGGTLLHLCVDNDEIELARWMIAHGADVNARAAVDADGFGGHTALFGCVVSQPHRVGLRKDDGFARLLLESGADPTIRASVRKRLRFVADETMHEYRDVTAWEFGARFHDQDWVNPAVMALLASRATK